MTSRNNSRKNITRKKPVTFFSLLFLLPLLLGAGCGVYRFNDVSIDPRAKTCKVNLIENRARIIDPQLAPQLTEKLRQKVNNQTRLTLVPGDADYEITCTITGYDITTSGISNQQASTNRLVVTVRVVFTNRIDESKNFDTPVSRNFDFAASKSLDQAQAELTSNIIQNMSDEIFNRVFSNW